MPVLFAALTPIPLVYMLCRNNQKSVWHEPYTEKCTAQAAKQTFTQRKQMCKESVHFCQKRQKHILFALTIYLVYFA